MLGEGPARAFGRDQSYHRGVTHGVPAGGDEEANEFLREQESALDPGSSFGVGYTGDDIDDVSPPEMHLGEVPVGFEVDSLLPHLGSSLDGGLDPEPAPLFEFGDLLDAEHDPAGHVHPHVDHGHGDDDGDLGDLLHF
jgi:hypothetical protein